jgi:hypothetical protein
MAALVMQPLFCNHERRFKGKTGTIKIIERNISHGLQEILT